ncbi:cytochrome c family protein [Thermodesulfobacteriota bacterium]
MKKILLVIVAILLTVSACKKSEEKQTKEEDIFVNAEFCADCHEPIYNEWKESMHAKSAPMNDKVHAAVFKMTGNDIKTGTKDGKPPICLNCHVPIAALDGEVDLMKKPIYAEGVTCTFCHKIKSLKPEEDRGLGAHAYEYNVGAVYSAAVRDSSSDAHKTEYSPFFKKSEFCDGCHAKRTNSKGMSVCNTLEEYKSSSKSKNMQCQNCHMASKDGRVASSSDISTKVHFHGSSGGHNLDMLKNALALSIDLDDDKNSFVVSVRNKGAAHNIPTAAPLRQLFLKVVQSDKNGKVIKANFKKNPKEDKNSLFVVAFQDKNGNIGVPPWQAEKIAFDKRLKPAEDRMVMFAIESKKVHKVRAELYYRLVPEELAKDKGFDEYTNKSHLILEKEMMIKN